jgi:Fic family protein
MMSFRLERLTHLQLSMYTVQLIAKINEYKGKQELYKHQAPELLESLREISTIQSTEASNRIEGIVITDQRLSSLMKQKSTPRNRSEAEIAGYRDVLATIHASYEAIPVQSSVILQLHRDLYRFTPSQGGRWKQSDNVIEEKLPSGERIIRFQPISAFETPRAMESLCTEYHRLMQSEEVDQLVMIAAFILDFLCIHPFHDGNGRMARLLTLLLLYQAGYEVGRWISLEQIIEESKESYYESLKKSSANWHSGDHTLKFWMEYLFGTILAAYKELENRMHFIEQKRGNKSKRVEEFILHVIGYFTKRDIRRACPDIGEATINRVLVSLRDHGKIETVGKGRGAKWRLKG